MLDEFNLPSVRTLQDLTPQTLVAEVMPQSVPVVIKGLARDWPAVKCALESDDAAAAYLRSKDRGQPTTVLEANASVNGHFFYGPDMRDFNFHKRQKSISAALDQILAARHHPNAPYTYIQSTPVAQFLPGFAEENGLGLLPPAITPRIWISNATRAQTHNDQSYNIAVCVAGRRTFTLIPPDQLPNLYIGPLDHTPSGRAISLASLEAPDFEAFPRLKTAIDAAQVAHLEPGDALYVPKYWWHHVQAHAAFNILVNYWWGEELRPMLDPNIMLYMMLLGVRDLPPQEKAYWKTVFDHYVFGEHGDPAAHIEPAVRSALGPHTPEIRATLARVIQQKLMGKP